MTKLLKKASAMGAAMIMTMTMAVGICQAATSFSSVAVYGTGAKTLLTKKQAFRL